MIDTHIAKLMWDAYAIQAGWDSFDGKPLPAWDELSEDRQSCWVAAASVTTNRIKALESALIDILKVPRSEASWGIALVIARKALEGKDD